MSELHLCRECAIHLGYNDVFSGFNVNLPGLFGSFLNDMLPSVSPEKTERCPRCGSTFSDIAGEGKAGCSECYKTFYDKLLPSIRRMHGETRYQGKISAGREASAEIPDAGNADKIRELREAMDKAVAAQNFEEAAKIRDEIKALEGGDRQ